MGALEGVKKDASIEKLGSRAETTLESIRKVADEIIRQSQTISRWITETSHETQRQYQRQRQQAIRKEGMLQDTLAQLKEENSKLLEERQRLAQETETEQQEIRAMKAEQQAIEERQKQALNKKCALNASLVQISSEIGQLRRALKQEEEKEEKEGERVRKEMEYYSNLFGLTISTVEGGSVLFLFKMEESEYYFQISVSNDVYSIVKASANEKMYKPALEELESGHDLFLFVKRMKEVFEEEHRRKTKENCDKAEV
ncbi:hypothetical protein NEMIN01_0908 [Nematocida minor]|uniref:uncharacterized protein n=1 Tax=Nematocida minor TaxID=1912983 RepID=UPI00221E9A7B|nr:uncharacterized protein NEMIN01_0908 [Nematocida minor]KAI5190209.1 hypothetical protein NEMIN01_0908 [Nematocida minor]